jgi:molybdopterin converting factor small subunit
MNITVRYHGIVGDMLHRKTQQVEMPDGSTVSDLVAAVIGDDEDGRAILKQTRAFIDSKQADRTAPLADGAEVTFMRPIAGGAGFALGGCHYFQGKSLRLGGAGGFTASGGGACGSGGRSATRTTSLLLHP